MSISDIRSFLGRQNQAAPEVTARERLQQEGLRQAREFNAGTENNISSRYSLAYAAISESLQRNVRLNDESPQRNPTPQETEEAEPNGFNFSEVVDNVFSFVSRVIQGAAEGGANDEELSSLFDQAREGIGRGIASARQDLKGVLDDELSRGIDQVDASLEERLSQFQQQVFAPIINTQVETENLSAFSSTELRIRTRDGDDVTLFFGQSQSLLSGNFSASSTIADVNSDGAVTNASVSGEFTSYLERLGISLSINGDIDEDEAEAITDLIEQLSSVADEFFNGDVFEAFERALELGVDEQELVSFSAQFTRSQSIASVTAYEEVQNFSNATAEPLAEQRSVNQYVDDLIQSIGRSRELLESNQDYTNLVNGIVNSLGEEVQTPDLVSAITRFNQFNNRLLNALP